MILQRVKELQQLLGKIDYESLWHGFSKAPIAVYNEEYFYIDTPVCGSMLLEKAADGIYRGRTDERFMGNTAITIGDDCIAIWNESTIGDIDNTQLASLIVHEMFHVYQLANKENRFPNEWLGVSYPITIENLHLRNIERERLLRTCITEDEKKKIQYFSQFLQLRKERTELIGKFIDYEKGIETVEGTAVYIEYSAYEQLLKEKIPIIEYIKGYRNITSDHLKIRHSTFHQGLLMALIADDLLPNWKSSFMKSTLFLSDFIERELERLLPAFDTDLEILKKEFHQERDIITICIREWKKERDQVFQEFERTKKNRRITKGVRITGVDPMNLIKQGEWVIHRNFLRIDRGNGHEILPGPVKTKIRGHLFDVELIEW